MDPRRINLFTLHSRSWQTNRYVYPVISRRSQGLSIGVNLNPDKVCNFDCIYCCVDRTQPVPPAARNIDLPILSTELDQMLNLARSGEIFQAPPLDQTPPHLRRLNDVAFSGDGEPTASPLFGQACHLAADLLHQYGLPNVKIVVITNATLLHRPPVIQAMEFLDHHNGEIWAKLDAGTDEYYQLVDRTSVPLARVLQNISQAGQSREIVIQSLFMKVRGEGPADAEISAYADRLRQLIADGCRIKLVQVYTVARQPAESFVQPLEDQAITHITKQVQTSGLPAAAFF